MSRFGARTLDRLTDILRRPELVAVAGWIAGMALARLRERRLLEHAQEAIRIRDHVVAVISHDLRNPLSALDIVTSLMRDTLREPESRRQLEVAQRSVRRMKRLLDDMQDASSIQAGKLALDRGPVGAEELVGTAIAPHEAAAAEKRISISRSCEPGLVVYCDADRIRQVLGNLLSNAIAYSPAHASISVRVSSDSTVLFEVADTGPGISEADLTHVFEPYWSGGRKHAGLGLYICRGIVEAHGGRIWAESRPAGTRMCFVLPFQQV